MENGHGTTHQQSEELDPIKLIIATIIGIVILAGALYGAYLYSQSKSNDLVLPGGVTYLGPTEEASTQPPTAPLRFTIDPSTSWRIQEGRIYSYSFSFPETLALVVFPGDETDSVAIEWGNIPPQLNILANIEFVEQRDPAYVNQPKMEFVKNWFRFFSGLKGVDKVEPFTNTNGLKGYKAYYINHSDQTPNVDVFFEIPEQEDKLLHFANGVLDPKIFDRMIDSVKWTLLTPTPSIPLTTETQ